MNSIKKLNKLLNKKTKKKLIFLFILMIFAALFETAGIGLIVPFVGIVTEPSMIHDNIFLSKVYNMLGFKSTNSFIIAATLCLIMVFVLKNIYLIGFHYIQYRIIYYEQVTMSRRLFHSYLTRPYTFHLQRNSAELLRNTNIEIQHVFTHLIRPVFAVLTEALVIMSILVLLLIMAPIETIVSGLVLGGSIGVFFIIFHKKILNAGKAQQRSQGDMIKWVNQGLGAGKEVKVSGRESFFVDSYKESSVRFANSLRFFQLIRQVPRMFVETIVVMTILLLILFIMLRSNDLSTLLATVSLFAMAAFRLMPSITRMVSSQTHIRNTIPSLNVVYDDLIYGEEEQENIPVNSEAEEQVLKYPFKKDIVVEDVLYSYPDSHIAAVKHVSLRIPIGQSVGIIGPSGSGKTTMVDIILGVLEPTSGTVKVDGYDIRSIPNAWKRKIGYIPQDIFLSDDSIRHNVAFGIEADEIDDAEVLRALEQAQLKEFVEDLPKGLDTFVGERGVRLSGGQRQRIGIARALYHNPEILFMDEATSALDNETEKEIMKAIDQLKGEKTLIIIAHRLSTIENCDVIFEMDKGKLVGVETNNANINR